jgi:hypothetical protein
MTTDFILKDATDEQLANAVEENLYDMFRNMVDASAVTFGGQVNIY